MTDFSWAVRDFLFFAAGAAVAWWIVWAYVEMTNAKYESNERLVEYLSVKLAECQRMAREAKRDDRA